MRAVTWQGRRDVRVETVPDPRIEDPTDAVIKVSSTNICGSDLHLYEVLTPFMTAGDVLGHEAMGTVEEVGSDAGDLHVGDRVVIPFQVSCGRCYMCDRSLYTQCETTQVREQGTGAALFGYSSLYGSLPGGQAEYLRVPQAQFTHIKVPDGPPDSRFGYLSDVLPTAWQAVEYADVPDGGSVAVLGLGPIGDMAARIAKLRGHRVIGVDPVPERRARAAPHGVETLPSGDDVASAVRDVTAGRGTDSVIDAVGMEAHGSPIAQAMQRAAGVLPDSVGRKVTTAAGVDRLAALLTAFDVVRRGGTVSVSGVYGGMVDPLPMFTVFDKQIQIRTGQANVKRWTDAIMPLLTDADPLGVDAFASHELPLADAPDAYAKFQSKSDGYVKVVLRP
ncbi:alcohol dehydrogenase catalytic domain-containing protein [Gordonia humi]|uniref:Threonine dehydrogenase-like Zn-dependent dehydrogenase n=1 Tax=Gordonia humi TaxID=686429 RepID=A0A840F7R1_9ACTN|nr:alcohol dehydrogenase catalytic domain-containing protein [Gordonia humi]MBB4136250.1 threonine dehydrogenase-like Zn-dependent dehydrogenase [Gordonia humi]